MPLYTFQCFKVPETICRKLDAIVKAFWWGHDLGTRKLHLIGWDKICQAKSNGGLGFRKFNAFNQAMLTKQFWRIQNYPDSLLARTSKAKYFPKTHLQGYIPKPNHSWTWKNIGKPQFAELGKGRWLVGSGHQISLQHPDWFHIPYHILRDHNLLNGIVVDLIHPNTKTWNWDLLGRLYDHNTCVEINKIPIAKTDRVPNTLTWKYSNSGEYNVAKAYSLIQQIQDITTRPDHIIEDIPQFVWKALWKVKLPMKITTFIWKLLHDSLLVLTNLIRRGIQIANRCLMCDEGEETMSHLFLQCPFAKAVWYSSSLGIRTSELNHLSMKHWLLGHITATNMPVQTKQSSRQSIFTILWTI